MSCCPCPLGRREIGIFIKQNHPVSGHQNRRILCHCSVVTETESVMIQTPEKGMKQNGLYTVLHLLLGVGNVAVLILFLHNGLRLKSFFSFFSVLISNKPWQVADDLHEEPVRQRFFSIGCDNRLRNLKTDP